MMEFLQSTPVEVSWMSLLTLSYICGVAMAIYVVYYEYSPQSALAWSLALIFIPIPSIAFYLAFGSGRIRRQNRGLLPEASKKILRSKWISSVDLEQMSFNAIAKLTGMAACGGNEVELLQNGGQTFNSIAEAVEAAQESILIEFYIIKDDYVGRKMRELLVRKAKQGLKIHIIYDEIGSHKLPLGFILRLKMAGVKITPFHGKRFWLSSILRVNYRNHRKLVIVDGRQAWLGGLNVANEYYGGKSMGSWRDTFMRVKGPVVAQAFHCFADDWYRAQGEDLTPLLDVSTRPSGHQVAMMVHSAPDNTRNTWLMTLLELCSSAKKRIWLAAPYLVPNHSLSCALQAAALRGVEVIILVPRRADHGFVHLAMLTYLHELESCGIRIMGYTKEFMHQKVLMVDDCISWVGSANLDMRSLSLNYELGCLVYSKELALAVKAMLLRDQEGAIPMTSELLEQSSVFTKFAARLCRLMAPVL